MFAQTMRHDEMQSWLLYYLSTFEMSKAPIHNVADPSGVVHSQAIESPEGEVRLKPQWGGRAQHFGRFIPSGGIGRRRTTYCATHR